MSLIFVNADEHLKCQAEFPTMVKSWNQRLRPEGACRPAIRTTATITRAPKRDDSL
jgi:hypothetical protein